MLRVENLSLEAPDGRPLVEGLTIALEPGQNLLVLGPGGSGKSQLLRVLAGTQAPRAGRVGLGDQVLWPGAGALALAGRVRLAFVFAQGGLLSNQTLRQNVALPLRFGGQTDASARTDAALARFGLRDVAACRPHAMSACERKLANLARAWALEPRMVLVDDPLEGVEAAHRPVVLDTLHAWAQDAGCILVVAAEDPGPFTGLPLPSLVLSPPPGAAR